MIRKALALALATVLTLPMGALPAQSSQSVVSAQVLSEPANPAAGEFDAFLYRSKTGQHFVLRLKYPQVGQKIQLMRVEAGGKLKQVFTFTLQPTDLDSEGNYLNLVNGELVRVFALTAPKTTFQLMLNGKQYLERKTIIKTAKPLVKVNSLKITAPTKAITGSGDFRTEIRNLMEGAKVNSVCYLVDGNPLNPQMVNSVTIGSQQASADGQGCVTSELGIDPNSPIVLSLNTKALLDGSHTLISRAGITLASKAARVSESSAVFISDNTSLNATAPLPTISGTSAVGQYLTVSPGNWGSDVSFSYKWYSNGAEIRGATSDRYLLTYADIGSTIRAEVIGQKSPVDIAAKSVAFVTQVFDQDVASPSQGSISWDTTSYNVYEEGQFYDWESNSYITTEVNDYDIELTHPTEVICSQTSSYYSTCSFNVSASWSGWLIDDYEFFSETVSLVRVSDRSVLDTDYIFLSTSQSSDSLSFSFSLSSLSTQNFSNRFRIEIANAGYNQQLTQLERSTIQIVRGPNTGGTELSFSTSDPAFLTTASNYVFSGGTATNPNWKLWQYAWPSSVSVSSACHSIPFFIAPQSLYDGSLDDSRTKAAADAIITVYSSNGEIRERVSINGARGDWSTIANGNKVDLKVCGLDTQKGKSETLRIQLDLRYDAYNQEALLTTSENVLLTGSLVFTKINCFQGEEGQVVNAHKPVCPEGWTQTKAKIINGKVQMKTINCLAGRQLRVLRAPEPKCPEGFEITKLAVKNGKLVPWTITCRKGFTKTTVRGVFPSCPAGFTRS